MTMTYCRFPAMVRLPDGSEINRAAVVVIDGLAELAVQQKNGPFEGGNVAVVATLSVVEVDANRRQAILTGDDGTVWEVSEGDGCGCRSPLQQWYAGRVRGQPLSA